MSKYDYWSLEKAEWDNGRGIENLVTFGINPIQAIVEIIDDETEFYKESNKATVRHLNFGVLNILENMEKCIYRLLDERHKQSKAEAAEPCEIIRSLEQSEAAEEEISD
jgi:hypothetical protein